MDVFGLINIVSLAALAWCGLACCGRACAHRLAPVRAGRRP